MAVTQRSADLARLVIDAQKEGKIDGWRDYITDQQKHAGISNQDLKAAIEREKQR